MGFQPNCAGSCIRCIFGQEVMDEVVAKADNIDEETDGDDKVNVIPFSG